MTEKITRKLDAFTAEDPLGRPAAEDPWRDFREVERIDFALEFRFRHSFGKLSRFFLELEQRRLMATRCPACGTVWMPPRPACGNDLTITEWVELSGRGTLAAASLSAYTLTTGGGEDQLVLGYVDLDGADTLMLQQIRNIGDPARLTAGLPLHAVWADQPVGHPMESFWFEPDD
jgi:uncharacterized OB-fold protein